jgi:hypothetical protein
MPSSLAKDLASNTSDASIKAATTFSQSVAASWSAGHGPCVLGAYLIGSLAHGGFSGRYSDVDMALIMDAADSTAINKVRLIANAVSPNFATRLSLFWTDRLFSVGRFPPLDRIDYLDHAVALVERVRIRPARPSLEEVRSYLRGTPFSEWAASVRRFSALDELTADDGKRYLRTLLYPARLVFSWMTGGVASNDDAVGFVSKQARIGLDIGLIECALACRHSGEDPLLLFTARKGLLQQLAACERLLATS